MTKEKIVEALRMAILRYDADGAANTAKRILEEGIDPVMALDAPTKVRRQVGEQYGRGELWLPELVGAANAMQAALPILQQQIERARGKRKTLGTVVIGT